MCCAVHPHPHPRNRPAAAGLALIELLLALGLLGLLLAVAVPAWRSTVERHRLVVLAAQAQALLQQARLDALHRGEPLRVSVGDRPGQRGACLVLHSGPARHCGCAADPGSASACVGGDGLRLREVGVPPGQGLHFQLDARSLTYDPQAGTTSPTGTVRLVGARGAIAQVVSITGRVRRCDGSAC